LRGSRAEATPRAPISRIALGAARGDDGAAARTAAAMRCRRALRGHGTGLSMRAQIIADATRGPRAADQAP
jgi:hypothetical protein